MAFAEYIEYVPESLYIYYQRSDKTFNTKNFMRFHKNWEKKYNFWEVRENE